MRGTVVSIPIRPHLVAVLFGCVVSIVCLRPASAQLLPGEPPVTGTSVTSGSIAGRVVDSEQNGPVGGVAVRLSALRRSEMTHSDGGFSLAQLPAGSYTLSFDRIGYAPVERQVEVVAGETTEVAVRMQPSALRLAEIVVTAGGREQRTDEVFQASSVLSGAELRRRMDVSVAATLAREPGITQRYNGPAAAQPVIRGLSGDRVLVLEDGNRTGDVSATSADHAVSVDPLGAERIEVVRGPAGLLYGSNALGGVVNVIREDIPLDLPEHLTASASFQAESVNRGTSGAARVGGSLGALAWTATLTGRLAGDTRTPLGALPSSGLVGHSAGAGLSWIRPDGHFGLAIRDFAMDYEVPGTFLGETIPGAHEGGVDIEMRRVTGMGKAAKTTRTGPFSSVELDGSYSWYRHKELEASGIVGTEFGQLSGTARLIARHLHEGGSVRREGALGLWALGKDFSVAGSNTGTRPAREYTLAGFGYEELGWRALRLQAGARYDWTSIEPLDTRPGQLGEVRARDFGAISASLSTLVELRPGFTTGVTVARAFRTPAIEELFSDGPHLADYSYNIGNPNLGAEVGFGLDLFARLTSSRLRGEAAVFRNRIDGFIHYEATGRLDPRLGRFPVYQAAQTDAVLSGAEGLLEIEALPSLVLHAQGSYVRGSRADGDEPLPAIPPFQGTVGARYERPRWFATVEWIGAASQDRVAENESATAGHALFDLGGGLRWSMRGQLHSLTLGIANLADRSWRDHLSRIRTVAPQPGRNLRLLYHVEL
jgi:iron complex outermembrane receptor protein